MPASFVATVVWTRPTLRETRWATREQAAMPLGKKSYEPFRERLDQLRY